LLAVPHPEAGVDKGRATGFITDSMPIRLRTHFLVTFCCAALGEALSKNSYPPQPRSGGRKSFPFKNGISRF
jgi:hypothetical protein